MLGIALYAAADNSYRNLVNSYDNAFEEEGFPDLFVTGGDTEGFAAQAADDRRRPGDPDPGAGRPADG